MLPHYENNCEQLQSYIASIQQKLQAESGESKEDSTVGLLNALCKRLENFRGEVDSMQTYQKKMMSSLAEAHLETRTMSERITNATNVNL
jgi:hypothetical protein